MRNRRIATGVGVALGGMLTAAAAQLAVAGVAHADPIVNGLTDTINAAEAAYTSAEAAFNNSDIPDALGYGFAGSNDLSLATLADLAEDGYLEFTNPSSFGNFFSYPELPTPTTLAATMTDVSNLQNLVTNFFGTATTDFGQGDLYDGAVATFQGIGYSVDIPQVEFIGLTDSLFGFTIPMP